MILDITPEDIKKGWYSDPWMCPIAQALKRTTGHSWRVQNKLYCPKLKQSIPIPTIMKEWAIKHDNRLAPGPISFIID